MRYTEALSTHSSQAAKRSQHSILTDCRRLPYCSAPSLRA